MKKLIPILIIAFLLCFIGESSAANKFFWATGLIDVAGALDTIDGASLTDGDMAIVGVDNSGTYEYYPYRLEDYESNPPDEASPDTITPNTNAESKRWKLLEVHAVGFVGPLTGNADTASAFKLADDSTVTPPAAAVPTNKTGIIQTNAAGASSWLEPTTYCFLIGALSGESFECATPENARAALELPGVFGELTDGHFVVWKYDGGVWKQAAGNLPAADNTTNGKLVKKVVTDGVHTLEDATAGTEYIAPSAIDTDLSSTSASDDTVPSAKATKAMGDLKVTKATAMSEKMVWKSPVDADDLFIGPFPTAITVTGLYCTAVGGGSSAVAVNECDTAAANCAAIGATVTADGGVDSDTTITDPSIAAGAWLQVTVSAPTGTVTYLSCGITYTY